MIKNKIGCVIAYNEGHNNYGTSLQGYALLKKIKDLGYDCEIIIYKKNLSFIKKLSFLWNAFRAGELKRLFSRVKYLYLFKIYPSYHKNLIIRTQAVNTYKKQKLSTLFNEYIGYENLKCGAKKYNAVIVGSDQVWSPLSLPNKFFNLLFVDANIPKIAYASSFGVSTIPKFQQKATGEFLNRFSYIGVREKQGKYIVDSLSNKRAVIVADPTLLLTKKEWELEIKTSKVNDVEPYIFCYFLGVNKKNRQAVLELQRKTKLKIITIRHMDEYVPYDEFFGDEAPYDIDPNDFVKYISKASYVCTDSFHCTVFSVIFNRKFMTFYRFNNKSKTSRNSRIDSFFEILNIDKARIYNGEIYKSISAEINYGEIEERLEKMREESFLFLSNALSNSIRNE